MNKYSYHWRDSMRFRAGLLWKRNNPGISDYPSIPKCIALLMIVFGMWGWAMNMDYSDQAKSAIAEKDKRVNQLLNCMNGHQIWTAEDGTEIGCMKAIINKRKN